MSWPIIQNDLEPPYSGQLLVTGLPVDLTGKTVRFIMTSCATGVVKVNAAATVVDAEDGRVSYQWVGTDTDTVGRYKAQWEVTSDSRKRTFPPRGYLYIEIGKDLG